MAREKKYINIKVTTVNKLNKTKYYTVNVKNDNKAADSLMDYFNKKGLDAVYYEIIDNPYTLDLKNIIYI